MRLALVVLCSITAVACATPVGDTEPTPRQDVSVVRAGSSTRGESLGVAALVRNAGPDGFRTIDLRVDFYDGDERVASTAGSLRFCRAALCWWGERYIGPSITDEWRSIDRVSVGVEAVSGRLRKRGRTRELRVFESKGEAAVRGAGRNGVVHVVAFGDREPRFGAAAALTRESKEVRPGIQWRKDETYRAYFYPGRVDAMPAD